MKRETMFKGCLVAALLAVVGFAMPAFAGSLEPPASAVDGSGNPVPSPSELPSWSNTIPTSERYVLVLNSEAVLDRETGLVWGRQPASSQLQMTYSYYNALVICQRRLIGNRRGGWHLASAEEIFSVSNRDGGIFQVPSEFLMPGGSNLFWTTSRSSSSPDNPDTVTVINFNGNNYNGSTGGTKSSTTTTHGVWCVRSGSW